MRDPMGPGARHGVHVPLQRRFRDVAHDPSNFWSRLLPDLAESVGWDALVPVTVPDDAPDRSAIVILAASGMGKSVEMEARAQAMRAAGAHAFFAKAVNVGTLGLTGAVDQREEFRSWCRSSLRAVFFVDAADEALLEGVDLEQVLLRFAQEVDPQTRKLQVVLSSRNDVWPLDAKRHLVRMLGLQPTQPPVRVVALEPLSRNDIRTYAGALGVRDAGEFMRGIIENELEQLLEMRPPDVRILADYWSERGSFGTWSAMLQAAVDASVRDDNARYSRHRQFTMQRAQVALRRLAAATVLGKRVLISSPGLATAGEVDAERLLPDQTPADTKQLLTMGLFAHKGLHSVQLPQGAASHYLAAAWLAERAEAGWDLDELYATLVVKPFGTNRARVAKSRAPLVGWVASRVPAFRARILRDLPHVVLFEGDPAQLPRRDVVDALHALADSARHGWDGHPTRGTLRQLANHDVSDEVLSLLEANRGVVELERLLLRIAEVGVYRKTVQHALVLATATDVDARVVELAIPVVATAGEKGEREQLLVLSAHPSSRVRLALVQSLVSDTLSGGPLVELVLGLCGQNVEYELAAALDAAALADLDAILAALGEKLSSPVRDDAHEGVVVLAAQLACVRLQRKAESPAPESMPSLLVAVETNLDAGVAIPGHIADALEGALRVNAPLRRAMTALKVSRAAAEPGLLRRVAWPRLGQLTADDFAWLRQLAATCGTSAREALIRSMVAVYRRMSPGQRAGAETQDEELRRQLEASLFYESEVAAAKSKAAKDEAGRLAKARDANTRALMPQRDAIEAGRDPNLLAWAWQRLEDPDHQRSRIGTGQLVKTVGEDLAGAFMAGFRRWWRHQDPLLPQPGDRRINILNLVGLTGIASEVEGGLDFAMLSADEARRAARHALHELNGLPPWFERLQQAHPRAVRDTLSAAVELEWNSAEESLGVIAHAQYQARGTAVVLAELVFERFQRGAPGNLRTIHHGISALLPVRERAGVVAAVLRRYVEGASRADPPLLVDWLRGWTHFAANAAATWLGEMAASDNTRFDDVVMRLAAVLQDDFDERRSAAPGGSWSPEALEAWVRVLHLALPRESDIERPDGVAYSPGNRDRAQEFRDRCLGALALAPTVDAHVALARLERSPEMRPYRALVERCVAAQLTQAAENLSTPWSEEDVLAVERADERRPATSRELFLLVQRHLRRVAALLENHDFSYARLFTETTDEKEVQRWVASSLTLVSRGLYAVDREPEVQDDNLMDISVKVPGVGRLPIEVKPLYADRYTYPQLEGFVSKQLIGQYMRPQEVVHGIFLLVPLVTRNWRIGGRTLSFEDVRAKLASYATRVGKKKQKEVVVACVNIAAARVKSAPRRAPSRAPKSTRRAASSGAGTRSSSKRRGR